MKEKNAERYDSINGLRLIACFGIVAMHVKTNIPYSLSGHWANLIINEFTNFVFLFMIISSFGMCCGYYNKIKNGEVSPEKFYSKRIYKILPFFICLLLLNTVIEHSVPSIIEAFANSTLMFGLLQEEISVLGVAWFIGLVFVFYFMFPFFTYLFKDKKSAWATTIIALLMNYSCIYYFNVGRTNMFYSFIYFCVGGLIYLYKNDIKNFLSNKRVLGIILVLLSTILYFCLPIDNIYLFTPRVIFISVMLLMYAISYDKSLLNNKVTKFIGEISLEIYLSHMVSFRFLEKIKLLDLLGVNWVSYIALFIIVLATTICGGILFKKVWRFIERKVVNRESIVSK